MKRNAIILLATVSLLASCKKDEPVPVDLGTSHFPTRVGHWVEYAVDSAWLDQENNIQGALSYPLRELLESDFTDPEGRPAQRILRQVKDSLGNWTPKDVWWQVVNSQRAERAEENLRKIKMVFPVRDWQEWNTNAYNTEPPLELTYAEVDVPWSANGLSFDSTSLVVTTYVNNLVDTVRYFERYARHVGLVYRRTDSSKTQRLDLDSNGIYETIRTKGTYLTMTVTAYGDN